MLSWEKANTILIDTCCLKALLLPRVIVHAPNVTLGEIINHLFWLWWLRTNELTVFCLRDCLLSVSLVCQTDSKTGTDSYKILDVHINEVFLSLLYVIDVQCFRQNKCFNICYFSSQSTIYLFINYFIVMFINLKVVSK